MTKLLGMEDPSIGCNREEPVDLGHFRLPGRGPYRVSAFTSWRPRFEVRFLDSSRKYHYQGSKKILWLARIDDGAATILIHQIFRKMIPLLI